VDTALRDNYRLLAKYNRWINQRLLAACEQLSDEERKRDRGAFFGSIHRTLSHLIVTDQVWLRRFAQSGAENGTPFTVLETELVDVPAAYQLDAVLFEDWDGLKTRRAQLDAAIEAWTAAMPQDALLMRMRYSNSRGVQREHAAWQAMTHFFNHQTHHRSQAITLLTQSGVDIGVTDLLALM
jgi:uncharacterized damage-inducible protein DinB